jgi:OOP family OmpA-OmpF porin
MAGVRLGYFLTEFLSLEASVQRAFAEADNVAPFNGENIDFDSIRLNALVHLTDTRVRPFVTVGGGYEYFDSSNTDSQHDWGVNGGVGVRFFAGDSAGVRLDGRYIGVNVDGVGDDWQHNYEAHVGLFFLFGTDNEKEEKPVEVVKVMDADKDGVVDNMDECPNTPTGVVVNAKGCEEETFVDEDSDGISDAEDQCPATPANAPVDENGCALDSDNDGVKNYMDRCPNTADGEEVDNNGCPVVSKARGALEGVVFKTNSPDLTPNAEQVLNGVAEELSQFPGVKVEVEGHTDSVGDESYNLQLSQKRAESVLDYLVSKGISRDRLTAVGYGETQPIADNSTKEGRFKNRRVELEWLDN